MSAQVGVSAYCLPRAQIVEILETEFAERKIAHGLSDDGNLIEIWVSERGTFTVLKTTPSRMSCVADSGAAWQDGIAQRLGLPARLGSRPE